MHRAEVETFDVYGLLSEVLSKYPIKNHVLMAEDICPPSFLPLPTNEDQGSQDHSLEKGDNDGQEDDEWVCLGLQSFKCMIGGIPRPYVTTMTNGWSLYDSDDYMFNDYDNHTLQDSRRIQRKIMGRLDRL